MVNDFIRKRELSRDMKIKIFKTIYKIILYLAVINGCWAKPETWKIGVANKIDKSLGDHHNVAGVRYEGSRSPPRKTENAEAIITLRLKQSVSFIERCDSG